MSSAVVVLLVAMLLLGIVVAFIARRPVSAKRAANWPPAVGTIQTVRIAYLGRNTGNPIYVGDFSYTVEDQYYSGTLAISSSFSTGNESTDDLVNQQIQVRYNPRNPEQYSVPQQEVGSFLLDPLISGI